MVLIVGLQAPPYNPVDGLWAKPFVMPGGKLVAGRVVFGAFREPASGAARLRKVSVEDSARWLASGWADLRRSPGVSLLCGGTFAILGAALFVLLGQAGLGSLVLPLAAGFLLVGPIAAMGLYEVSRRQERGQPPTTGAACMAWRHNGAEIALFGLGLTLAFLAWIETALLLFALFFHAAPPPLENFLRALVVSPAAVPLLIIGSAIGGAIAAAVFAASVVALPMLLDRKVTAFAAAATSIAAVRLNWQVMVGWGAVIALLVGAGIATFFVGLVVALPLAGHASWHAYRGMVI